MLERLDSPDLDDEIDTRPLHEVIADIRRDLGLSNAPGYPPEYTRRTPADVAELCARAAAPREAAQQSRRVQEGRPTPIRPVVPLFSRAEAMADMSARCTELLARDARLPRP